jgi:N-acetylmuramoyl-L-alanine amidase
MKGRGQMKKIFYISIVLACFLSWKMNRLTAEQPGDEPQMAEQPVNLQQETINRLNWVETYHGVSTQIMFDFSNPIYFEKKIIKENFQLRLIFPGMQLEQFSVKQVIAKLSELKKYGIIKNVTVAEKNKKFPKVVLYIDFEKTKQTKDKNDLNGNTYVCKPNRLLIKWYKMEAPNRLIIDIFTQEDLDKLKNKNESILFAKNDLIKSDITPNNSKSRRIVLDPGHGGKDYGAKGNGLIEKTIALDIAKRTKNMLEENRFNVLLTRTQDCDLSLVERSTLAEQLKADLFVSIHVNSTKSASTNHNGIETFYLQNSDLVSPTRHGGFLFINLKKDPSLITLIDEYIQANTQLSQTLAKSIQSSLIKFLKSQKFDINDRGVKADKFRVLLRSPIPAALVEVGFITNKNDASQLSDKEYRNKIAYGIFQGITQFIQRQ